jgi:hypothetical protein
MSLKPLYSWMRRKCLEWKYLFYTLNQFGFGSKFITWVRFLYSSPQASVRTNNTQSDCFPLQRSTRQGYPLSPLLFALAIEPIVIALRSNPLIKRIVRYGHEHKLSLYTDLLLYTSNLSVPAALPLSHPSVTYQGINWISVKANWWLLICLKKLSLYITCH